MQVSVVEGRRERKKREVRERIYQAARQLFQAHGFEATTVEQIAEAADVAQATLFNHFQSKGALLREMTGEVFEEIEAIIQEQLSRPGSVQERLAGFADRCALGLSQWKGLAHHVLLELARSSTRLGEAIPHIERVHEPFVALLEEGRRKGEVARDVDPVFAAELFVGAFTVCVSRWLNDPDHPIEERMRQTAAFFGEAIAAGRRAPQGGGAGNSRPTKSATPRGMAPADRRRGRQGSQRNGDGRGTR
jgi:AcrR family transcriptional regulator